MTQVTIKARHNGPFLVTGPITLTDADGVVYELPEGVGVALGRCGRSRNKPFCDKTHREIGFEAPERVLLDES
jgi:CDGSH-type Zn-finger protein